MVGSFSFHLPQEPTTSMQYSLKATSPGPAAPHTSVTILYQKGDLVFWLSQADPTCLGQQWQLVIDRQPSPSSPWV